MTKKKFFISSIECKIKQLKLLITFYKSNLKSFYFNVVLNTILNTYRIHLFYFLLFHYTFQLLSFLYF